MKKYSIPVDTRFLNKKNCLAEADRILSAKHIEGMSRAKLAREIFFHASVYDLCMRTGRFRWLKAHSDPINLNDGGDTLLRRICYRLMWKLRR